MNNILSRREALTICRDLWAWIAENSMINVKSNYGLVEDMLHNCPCCEYDSQHGGSVACLECPLKDYWGDTGAFACEYSYKSPYRKFKNYKATRAQKTKYALQIVGFCKKELKK